MTTTTQAALDLDIAIEKVFIVESWADAVKVRTRRAYEHDIKQGWISNPPPRSDCTFDTWEAAAAYVLHRAEQRVEKAKLELRNVESRLRKCRKFFGQKRADRVPRRKEIA